jgi:hypothetical protein
MSSGWQTKTFKTKEAMASFIERNGHRIQCNQIFINNGWGIEYRKLRRVG